MDRQVLEGIRIRDQLLSKFGRSEVHSDYVNIKKARNHVPNLIKRRKKVFVVGKLNENIGKPKSLWKYLKSLGLSSGKESPSKICLGNKSNPCFDDKTSVGTLIEFFSNLASNLVKNSNGPLIG